MRRYSARKLYKRPFGNFGGTVDEMNPPSELPEGHVLKSVNWRVHQDGKSREKRPGCVKHDDYYNFSSEAVRGCFGYEDDSGNYRDVVCTDKKIFVFDPSGPTWNQVYSQATAIGHPVKPVAYERGRPIVVGYDDSLTVEATTSYKLGIVAPTTAATAAEGAAGAITGTHKYLITFYRSGNYPCESNPSPESNQVTVSAKRINLTSIPTSTDPKVNARRIYRTKDDGETFYWLDDINDNSTTTYEDNYTDDDISGSDMVSYERYPPPAGDDVEVWDERIWILKKSENRVYFTNTGEAEEMAADNFFNIKARESDTVEGMKAFGGCLYIFKNKSWFKIEKIGDYFYQLSLMPEKTGCDAGGSIACNDDFMFWKSKRGIEAFNGYTLLKPKISRYVKRTLATINKGQLAKIVGEINEAEDEYWLSIPTGTATEPDKVVVLKIEKSVFNIYEFANNLTSFFNSKDGSEEMIFLSGTSDAEFLTQGSGYDDNGTAIEATFKTEWFPVCGEKEIWNVIRRIFAHYIATGGKKITLNVYKNFKNTAFASFDLKSVSLGDDELIRSEVIRELNIAASCTHVCLEFVNNDKIAGECRVITADGYFKKRSWKRDVTGE